MPDQAMDLIFRYAPAGGSNPLLPSTGGRGALMGVAPDVFWFFVAAGVAFVVVHALVKVVVGRRMRAAH